MKPNKAVKVRKLSARICFYVVFFFLNMSFMHGYSAAQSKSENGGNSLSIVKDFLSNVNDPSFYTYAFPEESSSVSIKYVQDDKEAQPDKNSGMYFLVKLSRASYAGAAFGQFPPGDISDARHKGFIELSIKGERGNEPVFLKLVDSGEKDSIKCEVKVKISDYIPIRPFWQTVAIPLSNFPDMGEYFDGQSMKKRLFDWDQILEVMFMTPPAPKDAEPFAMIYIKDIKLLAPPKNQEEMVSTLSFKPQDVIREDTREHGCFIGAFLPEIPSQYERVADFEALIGKKIAQVLWYADWATEFPRFYAETIYSRGYIPHITWEPWCWEDREKVNLKDIAAGKWDDYIGRWADDVQKWGKPLIMRFAHEFNGNWYPWSTAKNGTSPQNFIDAYRRVKDIFDAKKAVNVQWVWCPYAKSIPDMNWNDYIDCYPGDEYVDWIGVDAYNFGTSQKWSRWESFGELFTPFYYRITNKMPNKPIMIVEAGCSDEGGDKAAWVKDMLESLSERYSAVQGLNWFNIVKETNWRIDSHAKALLLFQDIIRKPYFLTSRDNLWTIPKRYPQIRKTFLYRSPSIDTVTGATSRE